MRSLSHYGHRLPRLRLAAVSSLRYRFSLCFPCSVHRFKLNSQAVKRGRRLRLPRKLFFQIKAFDAFDGDFGVSPVDDWGDTNGAADYILSSSEGEDSDPDFILNPISDIDLPTSKVQTDDSLTMSVHRLGLIGRGHKKRRVKYGILINVGLVTFLVVLLSFVDWCAWKIVRLPLAPFYLSRPFFISAALAAFLGYLCVPFLNDLKLYEVTRKRSVKNFIRRVTPTMGGLFLVPIGVGVARFIAGFSSIEVSAAVVATLAFSAIGFLDDVLTLVRHDSHGLSARLKILLQVAVGTCFSFWLDNASISTPYSMYTFLKFLIPLPAPLGLVFLGKFYLLLTSFSFVSMGNGVHLTDTLDGLAGGAAAMAFIGVSIAVLPISSELAIFGASMAGACVGFLLHNRYRASVFMGGTGSLALGGALAAMAACSGMFFPLFISSGIFLFEASSVIIQVLYFKITKRFRGEGQRLFRMAPFHHHLLLCGVSEPVIVTGAYVICGVLALLAGYVGLASA